MKKTALLTLFLLFITLTPTVLAESTQSHATIATPPGLLKKETSPTTNVGGPKTTTGDTNKSDKSMDIKTRIATSPSTLKDKNRHIVGKITALGTNSLTLLSESGGIVNITVDANTKYFDWQGPKKPLTFANLKVGDRIAVAGIGPGETTGLAIIIYRLSQPERHQAYFGTIASVSISTPSATASALALITHKPVPNPNVLATVILRLRIGTSSAVLLTSDTKFKITGLKNGTISDLKIGQRVVTTGILDDLNNLLAKNFIVIANGSIFDTNPESSGSGKPSTTSSKLNP